MTTFWKPRQSAVPFLLIVALLCAGQAPLPEPVTDQETELGQAVYNQLRDKGEIIESSPLYDSLRPIADAISRVAQPRYNHPFKFFLVHETHPNAFATSGGNVYVLEVGGTKVATTADVRKAVGEAQKNGKHAVLMRVKSDDTMKFVAIPFARA